MARRTPTMKALAACSSLALSLLAMAPQSAAAQATVPTWREITIYASDAGYPPALARRGVQGNVTVELALDDKGRKAVVAVRDSSRSAELDALALAMARRLDIPASGAHRTGLVTFKFKKDHSATIATKSCADFNVDAAWQAATFPERSLRELPVTYESVGTLIYSLHREGSARQSFPALEPILNATVAACARTPEAGMLDVMRQEALKLIEQ
ncbi:TonB family protein [Massilia timonae]|uniref:TonB family domain-containing protein n=1 Tax=Massilia timonae CCUG 45783 TaxID=883126 RepID=K9DE82_9BURK|nr:TonB family protein [Massilia timonae]EKU81576.1 TonB family domain-containing protein [Massilia timonae CCUG 45783]